MGCASAKQQSLHGSDNNFVNNNNNNHAGPRREVVKRRQSIDSPELAYQFIMRIREQHMLGSEQMNQMSTKQYQPVFASEYSDDIQKRSFHSCPRLETPAHSSLIHKRLQRVQIDPK